VAHPASPPPTKHKLPVEVIGANLMGQQFFERTHTLTIHRDGISIHLANTLAPDSEVILHNPENNEEAIAFVVGEAREDGEGHIYGLAYLFPPADPWHLKFPAAEAPKMVQLECSHCRFVCTLCLSSIEAEMFEAAREVTHPCKSCNSSTTWREGDQNARAKKASPPAAAAPVPQLIVTPMEERRKSRRMAMKASACIRYSGVEVVVACEDVSKEGFRFTGTKEYPVGTRVEAAVPYTKASTNIFCLAGIIYCHKMPDGHYRHGVTYTKNRGSIGWDP
jgi:PilZ domain-containing protein